MVEFFAGLATGPLLMLAALSMHAAWSERRRDKARMERAVARAFKDRNP